MVQDLLSKLSLFRLNNIQLNNRIAYLIHSLSVLIIILSAVYYAVTHLFNVKHVIIEGDLKHATSEQLKYVANNKLHGTFFTINIEELKNRFSEIPWVKNVVLRREFPSTIFVAIEEYQAVARFNNNQMITNDGKVFNADSSDAFPDIIANVNDAELALNSYYQIESIFARHNSKISKLLMNDTRLIEVKTESGVQITFCNIDLNSKLMQLDKYWNNIYQINPNLKTMNFCYKNAVAINSAVY